MTADSRVFGTRSLREANAAFAQPRDFGVGADNG